MNYRKEYRERIEAIQLEMDSEHRLLKLSELLAKRDTYERVLEDMELANEDKQPEQTHCHIADISGSFSDWYNQGFKDGLAHRSLKCKCGKN